MSVYYNHYPDDGTKNIYNYKLYKLLKHRNKYLSKKKLTVLDDTKYKEFDIICKGKAIDLIRLYNLDIVKKKTAGKNPIFRYDPKNMRGYESTYIFENSSGFIMKNSNFNFIN
jgi:hypothetical protein